MGFIYFVPLPDLNTDGNIKLTKTGKVQPAQLVNI